MTKKPWEEKVVSENETEEKISRKSRGTIVSTPLLTALLSIFFVIVVAILFVVFYTSNGGSSTTSETSNFYGASSNTSSSSSETSVSSSEENQTSSSSDETTTSSKSGDTIAVLAGEGAAAIAARAGISVETLYELNPDHMTLGYWYANPGDEVFIN